MASPNYSNILDKNNFLIETTTYLFSSISLNKITKSVLTKHETCI